MSTERVITAARALVAALTVDPDDRHYEPDPNGYGEQLRDLELALAGHSAESLESTARDLAECWSSEVCSEGPWSQFTCTEIEPLVKLMRAAGEAGAAQAILDTHSEGDDEGDDHYRSRGVCSVCGEPIVAYGDSGDYVHAPEADDDGDHTAEPSNTPETTS